MLDSINFDLYYKVKRAATIKEKSENLNKGVTQELNCIKKIESIYNKRHMNFAIVLTDKMVNPQMTMKFDVR